MEFQYEKGRIFSVNEAGKVVSEVTYVEEDGVVDINHTFVDESLRGQGVAGMLVKAAADEAVKNGFKIKASCSYAASWLKKHPEYPFLDDGAPLTCRI